MLRYTCPLKVLSLIGLLACVGDVAGILSSSLPTINGSLTVCTGDAISITCVHDDNSFNSRWVVTSTDPSVDCSRTLTHGSDTVDMCGLFALTMINDASPFSSTAQVSSASTALNGILVECFSSGNPNSLAGNITINVLDIPTPTIDSVKQVSQSSVRVNLTVADTQCVANYQVDATPVGGSTPVTSTSNSSLVDVTGLDVCQYNYIIVGSIVTAGGVQDNLSAQYPFSANLSVLNGITVTVNMMDPFIEWVQIPNPDYPTCIVGYLVTDLNNTLSTTVDSTVRSLTAQQLNQSGFPYCITIQPVVTPVTPMRPLMPTMGSNLVYTNLLNPDFPSPVLSYSFSLNGDTVVIRVDVQNVSDTLVPSRSFWFNINDGPTTPEASFNGSYFDIELPETENGDQIEVTVMFEDGVCTSMTTDNYAIPGKAISNVTLSDSTPNSQTITVTLPLTAQPREDLQIISIIQPPDVAPIIADFTGAGMQYTVMFTGLSPETAYSLNIMIVDVVNATTGTFMTQTLSTISTTDDNTGVPSPETTPLSTSNEVSIAIAVVVTFLLTLVLGVSIGALSVWGYYKCRKSDRATQQPDYETTEMRGPIYEELENMNSGEPNTKGNVAYGHVQFN